MVQYRFGKEERLRHRRAIKELFTTKNVLCVHPFKVFYQKVPAASSHHQVLFAVSRRSIKRAFDRNKVKRRSKEIYRQTKYMLRGSPKLHIGFVYATKKVLPFAYLREAIIQVMQDLNKMLEKDDEIGVGK